MRPARRAPAPGAVAPPPRPARGAPPTVSSPSDHTPAAEAAVAAPPEPAGGAVGRALERRHHALDAIEQLFRGELLPGAIDQEREGERGRPLHLDHRRAAAGDP